MARAYDVFVAIVAMVVCVDMLQLYTYARAYACTGELDIEIV